MSETRHVYETRIIHTIYSFVSIPLMTFNVLKLELLTTTLSICVSDAYYSVSWKTKLYEIMRLNY